MTFFLSANFPKLSNMILKHISYFIQTKPVPSRIFTSLSMRLTNSKYSLVNIYFHIIQYKNFATATNETELTRCYQELNVPINSNQDEIHKAFIKLAKKYHPDSNSSEANIDKFCIIENAYRVLSSHNKVKNSSEEIEKIVHDIKHTAPQHRQYLSFDGVGHGTPSQRMKQWAQAKAERAAHNVMEHRLSKAMAADSTLMKKEDSKRHDIKTKYGFDRLVEDLIQESISKGEFENLTGSGKPLRDQNRNPYVDFTTHKLNEVLINNGFTPEWITMNKDIDEEINSLKKLIKDARTHLGKYPLSEDDYNKWQNIYEKYKESAKLINKKINTYNIIVPLINKQKFYVDYAQICEEILKNGKYCSDTPKQGVVEKSYVPKAISSQEDAITVIFRVFGDFLLSLPNLILMTIKKENNKIIAKSSIF